MDNPRNFDFDPRNFDRGNEDSKKLSQGPRTLESAVDTALANLLKSLAVEWTRDNPYLWPPVQKAMLRSIDVLDDRHGSIAEELAVHLVQAVVDVVDLLDDIQQEVRHDQGES